MILRVLFLYGGAALSWLALYRLWTLGGWEYVTWVVW